MAKNKNIKPLKYEDLINEVEYKNYKYKKYFSHICDLIPNLKDEKIEIINLDPKTGKIDGLVYIMVIDGKILKIGETINTIKDRIQSYNCGKLKHRISGTASTTNFFILQSILKINKKVNVFAMFPPKPKFKIFGKEVISSHPPVKIAEKKLIKEFINDYGKKPIGITQR